jgi:glycosyltransferase involved in cell wall biosynthesis
MKRVLIMMDKLLCKCATHVYPEGNGVKHDLIKHKITKKPLKVIAHGNINGIDLEEYNPSHFTDEFKRLTRQKYGIDDEDFVFLFVGRLVIDKGLRELVSAFNHLSKKTPHIKLVLVGPRENEKSTKKKKCFLL